MILRQASATTFGRPGSLSGRSGNAITLPSRHVLVTDVASRLTRTTLTNVRVEWPPAGAREPDLSPPFERPRE
ncbi:hypothetical protein I551_3418 [Mycobacterium ulcerans str. Harvey]|uniref:Uncharacterized protein n=1 Tax=Mycobacterium ulcerans str. Harvey TaxID=1299332 RepID=A0ABN0QZ96_MYCUL|nr:hypothetical protein I551_3418 [Mycobacterium ulcerans str. Harvey]